MSVTAINSQGVQNMGDQFEGAESSGVSDQTHVSNESGDNEVRVNVNPDGSGELWEMNDQGQWEKTRDFSKDEMKNLILNTGKGSDKVTVTGYVPAGVDVNIEVRTDGSDDSVISEVDFNGTNADVTAPETAPEPETAPAPEGGPAPESAPAPEAAPQPEPGSGGEAPAASGDTVGGEGANAQQPASVLSSVTDGNTTTDTYSDGTVQTTSNNADGSTDVNTQYADGSSMTASYDESGQLEQMAITPAADGTPGMAGTAAAAGGAPAASGDTVGVEDTNAQQPGAINPGDPATLSPAAQTQNEIYNQIVTAREELLALKASDGHRDKHGTIDKALAALDNLARLVENSTPEELQSLVKTGALQAQIDAIGDPKYHEDAKNPLDDSDERDLANPELDEVKNLLSAEGYQAAFDENAAAQTPVNPVTGEPTAAAAPTPTTASQTNASSSSGAINYNGVTTVRLREKEPR